MSGSLGTGQIAARLRKALAGWEGRVYDDATALAACRMLYDHEGRPDDFVYLAVNPAFERLTGLNDVAGKRVTEVFPTIKAETLEVLETYGKVARTGAPAEFEIDFTPLGLRFHVSAVRPEADHFMAVF